MKILAIETSTGTGSVAVLDTDRDVREQISFPEGTRHGKALVPSVADLLARVGWEPSALDAVAVSIGPGSYTGLRVGLVCGKIAAAFAHADLVAVPSLDVIAHNADKEYERVCAVSDARRDQVYASTYERAGGTMRRMTGYAVVAPKELLGTLREDTLLVGDGIPVILSRAGESSLQLAPEDRWVPRAETVASLGAALHAQGVRSDPYSTEPMYLRKAAAEEKWDRLEAVSK